MKWVGLVLLAMFSLVFWIEPVGPDFVVGSWIFRIAAPIGAIATLIHLLRTPRDPVVADKLATVSPSAETECPFCRVPLLVGDTTYCPLCGILRV